MFRSLFVLTSILLASVAAPPAGAGDSHAKTRRVGVAFDGAELGRGSEAPLPSENGRFVVFASKSPKVVLGDDNNMMDVFVRDRIARTNEIVSVATDGTQGNSHSFPNAISADGRFVVFTSSASTFAQPDVDPSLEEAADVFIRDRELGTTERVSVDSDEEPALGPSFDGDVSDDGRFVSFESGAANLVDGDDNQTYDIFVRDRTEGMTEIVSVRSNGTLGNLQSTAPSISGDGDIVAFDSDADNLVSKDTNQWADAFVHVRSTGMTKRISITSEGRQSKEGGVDAEVSGDGSAVLIVSQSALVPSDKNGRADAYVYDVGLGTVEKVSRRCSSACYPTSISTTGRYVTFSSSSPNIVPGDTNGAIDHFWFDRASKTIRRVSVNSAGRQARGEKGILIMSRISGDGRFVAFESSATNLVANDTNKAYDTFIHGPLFSLSP